VGARQRQFSFTLCWLVLVWYSSSLSLLVPFRSVDLDSILVLLAYLLEGLKRSGKEKKDIELEEETSAASLWLLLPPHFILCPSSPTRPLYRPPVY